jgi:hypothetical protein
MHSAEGLMILPVLGSRSSMYCATMQPSLRGGIQEPGRRRERTWWAPIKPLVPSIRRWVNPVGSKSLTPAH